jgi:phosphoribosylanthranilate isomerase
MFRIKICGIMSVEDALLAAEAGADAIGLNFYEKSPRYVTPKRAREIVLNLGYRGLFNTKVRVFGVFVNRPLEQILGLATRSGVAAYQLHGDETPEMVASLGKLLRSIRECAANALNSEEFRAAMTRLRRRSTGESDYLGGLPIDEIFPATFDRLDDLTTTQAEPAKMWSPLQVRALRQSGDSLSQVSDYLRKCDESGALPDAVLLDAHRAGAYGGTGETFDWNVLRTQRDMLMGLPLILAGGLTPDNVAQAIATARPDAVDVASGVESAPGKKDPAKVRAFVAAAKNAFAALDS